MKTKKKLTEGLELDDDFFTASKLTKGVLTTGMEQAWNLMNIYLSLNKSKSHCENDSELTKSVELDEYLFSAEQVKKPLRNRFKTYKRSTDNRLGT